MSRSPRFLSRTASSAGRRPYTPHSQFSFRRFQSFRCTLSFTLFLPSFFSLPSPFLLLPPSLSAPLFLARCRVRAVYHGRIHCDLFVGSNFFYSFHSSGYFFCFCGARVSMNGPTLKLRRPSTSLHVVRSLQRLAFKEGRDYWAFAIPLSNTDGISTYLDFAHC